MKVLVTGSAGFIGYHVAAKLIERGDSVVGFDVVNDYYDVNLKRARLSRLEELGARQGGHYRFVEADIADSSALNGAFEDHRFDRVVHLAAQAGVRYSIENPQAYVVSNLIGFSNLLEACRRHGCEHLVYASTSSVYGGQTDMPFSEGRGADHPLQFYAATKRANELMAHSYSHLYSLPTTGLRFFTVYGPWGRPDMALFKFTRNILAGEPIEVFNHGNHTRDFTYVDDIVEGVVRTLDKPASPDTSFDPAAPDSAISSVPFRIFNIGNSNPVKLMDYIRAIETALGREAKLTMLPLQPGDAPDTFSDTSRLAQWIGYAPSTSVTVGVSRFVDWYRDHYRV